MNNTDHKSNGNAPSVLLFDVHQKDKTHDLLSEYLHSLEDYDRKAEQNIAAVQSYNKQTYDKKHKEPHKYETGDCVARTNIDVTPR